MDTSPFPYTFDSKHAFSRTYCLDAYQITQASLRAELAPSSKANIGMVEDTPIASSFEANVPEVLPTFVPFKASGALTYSSYQYPLGPYLFAQF